MAPLNAGDKVPLLNTRLLKVASVDSGVLVTLTVYVLVVVPSCAVTTVVMVLLPTARAIEPDAEPLVTVLPFTVTVAVASLVVGVTVMLAVALGTLAVYAIVPLAKAGLKVPELSVRLLSVASVDNGVRVKLIV